MAEIADWVVAGRYKQHELLPLEKQKESYEYACVFGPDRAQIGRSMDSCTGSVYSYWYEKVHASCVYYDKSSNNGPKYTVLSEPRLTEWFKAFAESWTETDFCVQYAGREGNAEVELLFCLSPLRKLSYLAEALEFQNPILGLERVLYEKHKLSVRPQNPNYGVPRAQHGGVQQRADKRTQVRNLLLTHGWAIWWYLCTHGAVLPTVRHTKSMPVGSKVISTVLSTILQRDALVASVRAVQMWYHREPSNHSNSVLVRELSKILREYCIDHSAAAGKVTRGYNGNLWYLPDEQIVELNDLKI